MCCPCKVLTTVNRICTSQDDDWTITEMETKIVSPTFTLAVQIEATKAIGFTPIFNLFLAMKSIQINDCLLRINGTCEKIWSR